MTRSRLTATAALALAFLLLLAGCATGPRPGTPLTATEFDDLTEEIVRPLDGAETIRATGTGQVSISGRTVRFGFALLQSGPSWMRIDFRPDIMGFGAGLNALVLIEGACARAYFPARVTEIRGCFDDILGLPPLDGAASLATGFPDRSLVRALESATLSTRGETMTVRGSLEGTPVEMTIETTSGTVTKLVAGRADLSEDVTIEYGGRGWKDGLPWPRTVDVVAREGTSDETRVRLEFTTFRTDTAIDRALHELPVLPGARQLSWSDLFDRED